MEAWSVSDDSRSFSKLEDNTFAANLCEDLEYTYGGTTYNDWFLPSYGEMNQIRVQWELVGISTDGTSKDEFDGFWSSTEYYDDTDSNAAFLSIALDYSMTGYYRNDNYKVLPVRAF